MYNEWHSLRIFSFTVTVAESVEFAEALDFILPDIMQLNKEAHSPLCIEDLFCPAGFNFCTGCDLDTIHFVVATFQRLLFEFDFNSKFIIFKNEEKFIYCHIYDNNTVDKVFEEIFYRNKTILY